MLPSMKSTMLFPFQAYTIRQKVSNNIREHGHVFESSIDLNMVEVVKQVDHLNLRKMRVNG